MGQIRVTFGPTASLVATLFLIGVALAQSHNQESFYMQVSTLHGVIAGESKDAEHSGWIELRSVRYEVGSAQDKGTESGMSESHSSSAKAAKSPRDAASGQASGKRQWGPVSSASSQRSAGRRTSEIVVTKITDKASPQLLKAETSGEHLPQVVLEICRGGVCSERLLLRDVSISSYKTAPHAADVVPTETVTLEAARIEEEAPRSETNVRK
jgi:type VI protein secretion system component Hcp